MSFQSNRNANIWYPRRPNGFDGTQSYATRMSGMKSRAPSHPHLEFSYQRFITWRVRDLPNTRRQVFQCMPLRALNGNPWVSGPAYKAGASAMKSERDSPSSGTIPCADQ